MIPCKNVKYENFVIVIKKKPHPSMSINIYKINDTKTVSVTFRKMYQKLYT